MAMQRVVGRNSVGVCPSVCLSGPSVGSIIVRYRSMSASTLCLSLQKTSSEHLSNVNAVAAVSSSSFSAINPSCESDT